MEPLKYIIDSDGFYRPILFLVLAFILYIITAKRYPRLVWLTLMPIVAMPIYSNQKADEMHTRAQMEYLTESMSDVYDLHIFNVRRIYGEDDTLEMFMLSTPDGQYKASFNKGKEEGFELTKATPTAESLTARKNALEVMNILDIDGHLTYIDSSHYHLDGDESYTIEINENNRVEHVSDESGEYIYKNELADVDDGRELTDDDY